ncbi:ribonuclease H-like domain-containing protein [Tanacetum coccineum]
MYANYSDLIWMELVPRALVFTCLAGYALRVGIFTSDGAGCCVVFGDNLLSWSSKRQHTLSHFSAEAEYRGVANVIAETTWLCNLLRELHTPLLSAILVYYENVRVLHVLSHYQYADIFTKGLPSALFEEFCTSLSVRSSPTQTTEEC